MTYCNKLEHLDAEERIKKLEEKLKAACGDERPARKTLCQLKKGHKGSCRAVIFWEKT